MVIYIILLQLLAIGIVTVRVAMTREAAHTYGVKFAAALAVCWGVAFFSGSPILYLTVSMISIVLLSLSGLNPVICYIVIVNLLPDAGVTLTSGGAYLFKIAGLDAVAIGAIVGTWLTRRRATDPAGGFTVEDAAILATFLIFSFGVTHLESASVVARGLVASFLANILPYLLLRRELRGSERIRGLLRALTAGAILLSIYALYEVVFGWHMFNGIKFRLNDAFVSQRDERGGMLRTSVTMGGPLMFSCWMTLGWIATACSRTAFRSRARWLAALFLVTLANLAPQSRGNLACLGAVAVLILALRGYRGAAAAVAATCGGAYLLFSTVLANSGFFNLGGANDALGAYDYRNILLERGLEEAMKHKWVGLSKVDMLDALQDIQQGQKIVDMVNIYLNVMLYVGIIGVAVYVALLGWVQIKALLPDRRSTRFDIGPLRTAAAVMLFALLVQFTFVSFIDRMPLILIVALALCRAVALVTRDGRREEPSALLAAAEPASISPPRRTPVRAASRPIRTGKRWLTPTPAQNGG